MVIITQATVTPAYNGLNKCSSVPLYYHRFSCVISICIIIKWYDIYAFIYNRQIDELRKKKAIAEQEYRNSMPASSYQQQKLRVCEVCSAYLGIHDNDRRLADHFGGKLHLGFITIREKLYELKVIILNRSIVSLKIIYITPIIQRYRFYR